MWWIIAVFKLDGFLQKEVNQAILPENVWKKIIADSLFFTKSPS